MKKQLTVISFVILALVFALAALMCFFYVKKQVRLKDEKIIMQLINGLSADISQFQKKGFTVSFIEKYNVQASSENDIDDIAFSMTYDGQGTVSMSYQMDGSGAETLDLSTLLNHANGYLSGYQSEKYTYYNKDIRVVDGVETEYVQDLDFSQSHDFTIKIDGDDYYVTSDSVYDDLRDDANDKTDSFCGKIDKNILINTVSEERMAQAVSRLFFMETWTYVKQISDISTEYFKSLSFTTDEEVTDFIRQNNITVMELGETVKVYFSLDTASIVAKYSGKDLGELPNIDGNMEIERETGDIVHFEYNLGNYLLSILMNTNMNKPYFRVEVEDFILEGSVLNSTLPDKTLDRTFTGYNESNKAEFIYRFSKHLIPFAEQEG